MMYAWAQRPDTTVWDEPMYGNYLEVTGIDHPLADDILQAVPRDAAQIIDLMLHRDWPTPIAFYKNMAHHLIGIDIDIVDQVDNFLLTRDPADMLPSLAKGLGRTPTMQDAGYDVQVAILDRITASGRTPIVVDSRSVLEDPERALIALCASLDLDFDPAMMTWPSGPKTYDGVWGQHWYTRLHASTGFEPYVPRHGALPEQLTDLHEACAPLYERLMPFAI